MADDKNAQERLAEQQAAFNKEALKTEQLLSSLSSILEDGLTKQIEKSAEKVRALNTALGQGEDITKKLNKEILNSGIQIEELEFQRVKNLALLARARKKEDIEALIDANRKIDAQLKVENLLNSQLQSLKSYLDTEKAITEEKKKQNSLTEQAKKLFTDAVKPLAELLTVAGILKAIVAGALQFNKTSVEISKNLGYAGNEADRVAEDMQNIAFTSDNINVTLKNLGQAMSELSAATGGVAEYSADALETQVMLTKQFGLTGEEAAGIYKFSTLTGQSSSQVNKQMIAAFANTRNAVKGSADFKKTIAEAAKVSGQLAANFRNNPAAITAAIVKMQALGTTLEQTKSQGDKLLDFASSLESELQAELLTGKQLNLERARAAALAGDQVTLAEELAKNAGTIDEFNKMNVLQQKALAEAMGMTAEELANQLQKQKTAKEQGKSLAQVQAEDLEKAQKRQNVQDRFNALVEKLMDMIGKIGILLNPFFRAFEFITDNAFLLYGVLGLIALTRLPAIAKFFKGIGNDIKESALNAKKLFSKEGRAELFGGGDKVKETAEKTAGAGGKAGAGGAKAGQGIKDTLTGISKGIQSFAKVSPADIGKLALSALALVLLTPAIPALLLLQLVNGKLIQGALTGMGLGLKAIGNALSNPKIMIGLAVATLAIMGLGKALGYAAPFVESFGKVITAIFGGIATVVTAASDGIIKMFTAIENVDVGKLLAIGPALIGIGAGLAALGGGSAIGAIGSFVGGAVSSVGNFLGISEKSKGPIDTLMAIASVADPIQRAASSIQLMTSSMGELSSVLSTIDTSKLEALGEFSEKMSIGSAVKGITDLITAPVKAIGGMIEGSTGGGGNDNTAMITAINEVRDAVNKLYSKNQSIHMDGKQVGTTLSQGTYKSA